MKNAKQKRWRVDPRRTIRQWASRLKRFFDAFSVVGGILLVAGLLLLVLATALKVDWLRDAGGAMFVAGLSLIISASSGKEAVRQQNAKEANIRRKDEIYGPLYIELKQVWERLEEASRGTSAYPHWIQGVGEEPPPERGLGVIIRYQPSSAGQHSKMTTALTILPNRHAICSMRFNNLRPHTTKLLLKHCCQTAIS